MAEKIKLNKNSLRDQNQSLKLYLEFLPTLELRKQQLQSEVATAQKDLDRAAARKEALLDDAREWKDRLSTVLPMVRDLLKVDMVSVHTANVAGVRVPVFDRVLFNRGSYSLAATPWILDAAMTFFEKAIGAREQMRVLQEKHALLAQELVKTTQRINLYEKVLIPQTRENIRKIKVYLGDQQTAAVCRAKIAKNKIVTKAAGGQS
ncbi:MAG: V-type ATP synthase subunit D [Deltaproteobacteria bacterium HGW-Deltaproteobacteria-17]|jgi:V/A-type H+-transporting ATPase subunit D|nr:MAG: V-type ATP synthase subunit D [Deltaproteobacteria bacterium HGW-Deltaproteobacteria-17]